MAGTWDEKDITQSAMDTLPRRISGTTEMVKSILIAYLMQTSAFLFFYFMILNFILLFGQALYFGPKLKHALLNPKQMRRNGVEVDDIPVSFCQEIMIWLIQFILPKNVWIRWNWIDVSPILILESQLCMKSIIALLYQLQATISNGILAHWISRSKKMPMNQMKHGYQVNHETGLFILWMSIPCQEMNQITLESWCRGA